MCHIDLINSVLIAFKTMELGLELSKIKSSYDE